MTRSGESHADLEAVSLYNSNIIDWDIKLKINKSEH